MVWPLIAMAAVSLIGQSQQRSAEAKANSQDNKAIREANKKNTIATSFRVGFLNVQKAQEIRELQRRKFDASMSEHQALGSNAVNAAASGTVGASVDAVEQDIKMAYDRVRAQIEDENVVNAQNFNTELYDLIQGGRDALVDPRKFKGQSNLSMVGNTALQIGGQYFAAKMDLGLGSKANQSNVPMRK